MRQGALAALLVALGCLGGCGQSETPGPCDAVTGPASVELGTGVDAFEPIADGMTLPIQCGGQGGFHVWGAFRAHGFDLTNVHVVFNHVIDGAQMGGAAFDFDVAPTDGERYGLTAFLGANQGVDVSGLALDGKQDTFSVTVSDQCGNSASDSRTIVLDSNCATR